jgi:hypothetical protein
MDAAMRQRVRQRAGFRCEYCRLPEEFSALRFHVEHIIARQHRGTDSEENLALACPECNFRKGTNLAGVDPDQGLVTPLFHPRRDRWEDHFRFDGLRTVGLTPVGRTTLWLLDMNSSGQLRARELLRRLGPA